MKAIIVEDEKLSAEHLANLLKKVDKEIEVVGFFDSVKTTLEAINKGLSADIFFLDIHLADGLSFDIFTKANIETPVIFTTAFDDYAIKAFKFNSIDYLLKPISAADLKISLEKFKKQNPGQSSAIFKNISQVYQTISKQYKNRFMVKMGDNIVSVKSDEILHFVVEEGLVMLTTRNEKRYAIDYSLEQLEDSVDPKEFFRINRKVIVNINSIQKSSSYFNSRLKIVSPALKDDDCIVSRERVNDFKFWLDGEQIF